MLCKTFILSFPKKTCYSGKSALILIELIMDGRGRVVNSWKIQGTRRQMTPTQIFLKIPPNSKYITMTLLPLHQISLYYYQLEHLLYYHLFQLHKSLCRIYKAQEKVKTLSNGFNSGNTEAETFQTHSQFRLGGQLDQILDQSPNSWHA